MRPMRTTQQAPLLSLILLFMLSLPINGEATQRFITDQLSAPLRAGSGSQYKILAFLKSGTPLQLIQTETADDTWSQVQTENGTSGWIQTKYLSSTPSAQQRLIQTKQEISIKNTQLQSLKHSVAQLNAELSQLKASSGSLEKQLQSTQIEYDRLQQISDNAVTLDQTNRQLHEELTLLKVNIEALKLQNGRLKESQYVEGITHGTIAVLLGCLLTLFIPRMSVKKRTNGWD